jgi:hypothetical protein
LAARVLEAAGICTVIIGAARDIVNHCDMPLGNPLGRPDDQSMQRETLHQALELVATASGPVIAQTPFQWSSDDAWRSNFMRVAVTDRPAK